MYINKGVAIIIYPVNNEELTELCRQREVFLDYLPLSRCHRPCINLT